MSGGCPRCRGFDPLDGRGPVCRCTSQLDYLRLLRPGGSDDPGRVRGNVSDQPELFDAASW